MLRQADRAVLDALLPPGAGLLPGALETGFERFLAAFDAEAPASLRLGFRLALFMASWLSPLLIGRLPPLSRLDRDSKERALEVLGRSRLYPVRQLLLLLKTTVGLGYGADPRVRKAIGYPRAEPPSAESPPRGDEAVGGDMTTLEESFDYVIVGSGAAGAAAARVLADTGRSLAVVEEGPAVRTEEFGDTLWEALRRLYRGRGGQVARGRAIIPVLQGRCLGGSTVVNSGIVWRLPEDVLGPWRRDFGLGEALPSRELERHWETVERELGVRPTEQGAWGANNRLLQEAASRLKVSAAPARRNETGCRGSARCQYGCPFGAKQSMLVSYLPYAAGRGARLYSDAPVERVLLEGGRAVGVTGTCLEGGRPRPFLLRARRGVLVAASAVQTPGLLARSGIRSPHLGAHFQGHPGCALAAVFDQPVGLWSGATQGFESDEHRVDLGFKIETIAVPPEILFARLPGAGRRWAAEMARAGHIACWAVQLRARAEGSVRERFFGTDIRYDLLPDDMRRLRLGLAFAARLFFAAGAREVLPGVHGLPERLRPGEERLLEEGPDDPACYGFILSHLFGTARMAPDPRAGVVGTDFAVHGTRNLYVVDSSLFPTNTSVNPQHPIMGVAMLAAERIAERA